MSFPSHSRSLPTDFDLTSRNTYTKYSFTTTASTNYQYSLNHVLPSEDIEEILDLELGTDSKPMISMMNNHNLPPFSPPQEQYTLRNSHRQALCHLDDTAPFHISNNCSDFIRFYPHRSSISLRNYLPLSCKGIGTIITCTPNSKQPIIQTPVYFCPTATSSILSPSALI